MIISTIFIYSRCRSPCVKSLILLRRLERCPVFTQNDVAKIVNKGAPYVRTLLHRLAKAGHITRIERGKYTTHADPMLIASHLATPSYLSLWTALRFYGLIQQQPLAIFVMVPAARKAVVFADTEIIFVRTRHLFGYRKVRYADADIFMAEKEKAIVDALLHRLPLADISAALDDSEMDPERLSRYARRTGNASLIKRLGYLLERKRGDACGLAPPDRNTIPLDYHRQKKGKRDTRWRLIINDREG